jgi:hypothetical protein
MGINYSSILQKGIHFLKNNQLSHGEFRTFLSKHSTFHSKQYISSTYITTFVIYSIGFLQSEELKEVIQKSLVFLREEMLPDGIWTFYTNNRNYKCINGMFVAYTKHHIMPDLDCMACISYCLAQHQIDFDSNQSILVNTRNEDELFYTWLRGYRDLYITKDVPENEINPEVNCNVLLYLGQNNYTSQTCNYLNNLVENKLEDKGNRYFPANMAFYYLFSRAYYNNIHALGESKDLILTRLLSKQHSDGSFGSILSTAFAICTFLNFNAWSPSLDNSVEYIALYQNSSGSWPIQTFFLGMQNHYGSEELTTAICLEALSRIMMRRYYSE